MIEATCEAEGCISPCAANASRCDQHFCEGSRCYIASCSLSRMGLGGNAPSCFCEGHDKLWIASYRLYNKYLSSDEKLAAFVAEQAT